VAAAFGAAAGLAFAAFALDLAAVDLAILCNLGEAVFTALGATDAFLAVIGAVVLVTLERASDPTL
jgi:hypothetical protein